MTVVSTKAFAYSVMATPIIKAEKNKGFRLSFKFLKVKRNSGINTIIGQAFIITTLQELDIPVLSISLRGNQYIPQAAALRKVAKLKLVSEYVFVSIDFKCLC